MTPSRISCLLLVICVSWALRAQDFLGYGASSYNGILLASANPAAVTGSSLKLDVLLGGFGVTFNNSWASVKREAIAFPSLPPSWKNLTPNLPDNVYKNFVFHPSDKNRAVTFSQTLMLPSALYRVDKKTVLAFSWTVRQLGNVTGISTQLASLFEKEFDLSVLQNNHVQNRNFSAIRMSWVTYGITCARVVLNTHSSALSVGVTPKLLAGVEAAYFHLRNLDFLFSNKDTLSFLEADFSAASTGMSGSVYNIAQNAGDKIGAAKSIGFGVDVGVMYEWKRSVSAEQEKLEKLTKNRTPSYRLKAGISLVDVGRLRFNKQPNYYDMKLSIRQADIIRYIAAENIRGIDSLLDADYPANTGDAAFTVLLPTAVNVQADFSLNRAFFVTAAAQLTGFQNNRFYRVRNYSGLTLMPRFQSFWLDVAVPFSWNALSAQRGQAVCAGLMLRTGPVLVGTTDLGPVFGGDVAALNLYFALKVGIPAAKKSRSATP